MATTATRPLPMPTQFDCAWPDDEASPTRAWNVRPPPPPPPARPPMEVVVGQQSPYAFANEVHIWDWDQMPPPPLQEERASLNTSLQSTSSTSSLPFDVTAAKRKPLSLYSDQNDWESVVERGRQRPRPNAMVPSVSTTTTEPPPRLWIRGVVTDQNNEVQLSPSPPRCLFPKPVQKLSPLHINTTAATTFSEAPPSPHVPPPLLKKPAPSPPPSPIPHAHEHYYNHSTVSALSLDVKRLPFCIDSDEEFMGRRGTEMDTTAITAPTESSSPAQRWRLFRKSRNGTAPSPSGTSSSNRSWLKPRSSSKARRTSTGLAVPPVVRRRRALPPTNVVESTSEPMLPALTPKPCDSPEIKVSPLLSPPPPPRDTPPLLAPSSPKQGHVSLLPPRSPRSDMEQPSQRHVAPDSLPPRNVISVLCKSDKVMSDSNSPSRKSSRFLPWRPANHDDAASPRTPRRTRSLSPMIRRPVDQVVLDDDDNDDDRKLRPETPSITSSCASSSLSSRSAIQRPTSSVHSDYFSHAYWVSSPSVWKPRPFRSLQVEFLELHIDE
jgi:hypothetical protein